MRSGGVASDQEVIAILQGVIAILRTKPKLAKKKKKKAVKVYDSDECWHCGEKGHHCNQCNDYLSYLKAEQRRISKLIEEMEIEDNPTSPQQERLLTPKADTSNDEQKEESEAEAEVFP